MKKISKYFLSLILLLSFIFILAGCGSFSTEEERIISSIERVVEDGIAKLVIHYQNSELEDDEFELPKGEDGAGIKSVITTTKEDGTGKVLKIYFTDEAIDPVVFELSNGRSIAGVKTEVSEVDGQTYIWVKYDDGTTSEELLIPQGKDGVGFTGYDYEVHEDGSQTYYFHFSQDNPDVVVEIPAPHDGNGIKSIISAEDEDHYILTINYTNGEIDELRFSRPKSPTKWMSGSSIPTSDEGEEGDYFFDTYHKIIYTKESGNWIQVVSFADQEVFRIRFDLNDTLDGGVPAKMPAGARLSYSVRQHTYFDDNGYGSIPIPSREGYVFKGWYRTKNVTPTSGSFTDFTIILSDLELYAIWEEIE